MKEVVNSLPQMWESWVAIGWLFIVKGGKKWK